MGGPLFCSSLVSSASIPFFRCTVECFIYLFLYFFCFCFFLFFLLKLLVCVFIFLEASATTHQWLKDKKTKNLPVLVC